jgi:hypothetical protein
MSYEAKDSIVLDRQLKVQELAIPFTITGNATPASKSQVTDEPAVLFLQTQGVNDITEATGALDPGETYPSVTTVDANGTFGALVKVSEQISKVVSAKFVSRASTEILACQILGLSSSGDKFVIQVDSAVSLAAANIDATLEVMYIVAE